MSKQKITNGENYFHITKEQALTMELSLNKCINPKKWIKIGDALYNFHSKNITSDISVKNDEYNILKNMINKNTY